MTVGILGLGLIGGSMARAYALAGHTVLAYDKDESTLSFAMLSGAVHGLLEENTIAQCDLILLSIYPGGCAQWLAKNGQFVKKEALVMDLCGIKQEVCARCFPLAEMYGFTYVGGTPWRDLSSPVSNTAGQTSTRGPLWCWFLPDTTILSFYSG